MTIRNYKSTVKAQALASSITSSATSMQLSTSGTIDPTTTLPTSYPYTLVIDVDLDTEEIVTVTEKIGAAYTITRGQDGTSGVAHSAGAVVKHMVTARDLQEPQNHINATSGVHGITGSFVGSSDTQTLTNKTISGTANTLTNIAQSSVAGLVDDLALKAPLASPTFSGTVSLPSTTSIGTVTNVELGYVDGVTSSIQTQLDTKAPLASPTFTGTVTIPSGASISGFAPLASPTFTGTVTIPSGASISGYAPLASPTFTGTVTLPTGTVTSGMILDDTIVDADINSTAAIAQTKIAGMGAWQTWNPSLSNFTPGSGATTDHKYTQIGKTVICKFSLTAGTSPTMAGAFTITLPVTARATGYQGTGYVTQSSTAYATTIWNNSTTTISLFNINAAASSYANVVATSTNVPATSWWVAGSTMIFTFTYEAA